MVFFPFLIKNYSNSSSWISRLHLSSFSWQSFISTCFFNRVSSSLPVSSYPYQQHNHFSLLRATFYCCLWATMCRTNFLFSASFPSPAQKDNNKNPLRAPWRELNPSLAFRNSATTLNKAVSCHLSTHSSPEINPSCKLVWFFFKSCFEAQITWHQRL